MDVKIISEKMITAVKKYRYAVLVLLVGIALMCWPSSKKDTPEPASEEAADTYEADNFLKAEDLERILSQISGAGEVKVLLTYATGVKTIYHQDEDTTANETGSVIKKETVIVLDSSRKETALVSVVESPRCLGAVVLCKGAEQAAVKLAIVEAVSKATGLGADAICVLKMK